jgi:hypothetical protein
VVRGVHYERRQMEKINQFKGDKKMKSLGYFVLLCGLLNTAAWGESTHKNQTLVMRCAGLSCSASSVARRSNSEVKLGTFKSLLMVHAGTRTGKYEVRLGTFKSTVLTKGL